MKATIIYKLLFVMLIYAIVYTGMVIFYHLVYVPYMGGFWGLVMVMPVTLLLVLTGALTFYVFKKEMNEVY